MSCNVRQIRKKRGILVIKALIFDVDGTLADTERDGHRVAFNRAFADAGLDWNWTIDIYGDLLSVTGGKERIRYFLEKYPVSEPETDDLTAFIANLHKEKTAHYTKLLSEGHIPLRPGVERLLNEARNRQMRLAIATTTTPENVTALLENTLGRESIDWFEVIAAGDIVPAKKPAPDIFIWAMKKMDLTADEVVAFEDSRNGIISVQDAGIGKVVITVNGYTQDHDFSGASIILDQLGEADSPATVISGPALATNFVSLDDVLGL
jgi:HAD superfamily hydrolase (TIGR01509 family)